MAENRFENLGRFAVNLNERAAQGKLDPVIGRDEEIRRVLQILSRRTKNNPILVGEPGVGKTAISEGIAQKIVDGDVPENLKRRKIYFLQWKFLSPCVILIKIFRMGRSRCRQESYIMKIPTCGHFLQKCCPVRKQIRATKWFWMPQPFIPRVADRLRIPVL